MLFFTDLDKSNQTLFVQFVQTKVKGYLLFTQKQLFGGVLLKSYSSKFCKIHWKTPMSESLFE